MKRILWVLVATLSGCAGEPITTAPDEEVASKTLIPWCPGTSNAIGSSAFYLSRACEEASAEPDEYLRFDVLMQTAVRFAELGEHKNALRILTQVGPRTGGLSTGQADGIYAQMGVAFALVGNNRAALAAAGRLAGRRKNEYASDIHGALALQGWRIQDTELFRRHLQSVKHPHAYAATVAKLVLFHPVTRSQQAFVLDLIRKAEERVEEVSLPQHRAKLFLALYLACRRLERVDCATDYLARAQSTIEAVDPKDFSRLRRKALARLYLARTHAYLMDVQAAREAAEAIGYREWRALALPPLAYATARSGDGERAAALLKESWELTETLKDNVYRRRGEIQVRVVTDLAMVYARTGNHARSDELIRLIVRPVQRAEAYLGAGLAAEGLWFPFSWQYGDYAPLI